jgi:hypothetical protein
MSTSVTTFSLIFTKGFDAYWAATLITNGHSAIIKFTKDFGSINSFPVNQTSIFRITAQYKPQNWLYYGITVSV